MGSLINLLLSFLMGLLFGHQQQEVKTAQNDLKIPVETIHKLECRQQILEC